MDRQVDPPSGQSFFKLFGKHAFAANHGKWIRIYVSRSLDNLDAYGQPWLK
jgi:hypothetical protein